MEVINPFFEVENNIHCSELSAFHPYWDNYVKVRKICECEREQKKLNEVKHNEYLFQRAFSKDTTPEKIQAKINKRLSETIGAMNSINREYICKTPSGSELN